MHFLCCFLLLVLPAAAMDIGVSCVCPDTGGYIDDIIGNGTIHPFEARSLAGLSFDIHDSINKTNLDKALIWTTNNAEVSWVRDVLIMAVRTEYGLPSSTGVKLVGLVEYPGPCNRNTPTWASYYTPILRVKMIVEASYLIYLAPYNTMIDSAVFIWDVMSACDPDIPQTQYVFDGTVEVHRQTGYSAYTNYLNSGGRTELAGFVHEGCSPDPCLAKVDSPVFPTDVSYPPFSVNFWHFAEGGSNQYLPRFLASSQELAKCAAVITHVYVADTDLQLATLPWPVSGPRNLTDVLEPIMEENLLAEATIVHLEIMQPADLSGDVLVIVRATYVGSPSNTTTKVVRYESTFHLVVDAGEGTAAIYGGDPNATDVINYGVEGLQIQDCSESIVQQLCPYIPVAGTRYYEGNITQILECGVNNGTMCTTTFQHICGAVAPPATVPETSVIESVAIRHAASMVALVAGIICLIIAFTIQYHLLAGAITRHAPKQMPHIPFQVLKPERAATTTPVVRASKASKPAPRYKTRSKHKAENVVKAAAKSVRIGELLV